MRRTCRSSVEYEHMYMYEYDVYEYTRIHTIPVLYACIYRYAYVRILLRSSAMRVTHHSLACCKLVDIIVQFTRHFNLYRVPGSFHAAFLSFRRAVFSCTRSLTSHHTTTTSILCAVGPSEMCILLRTSRYVRSHVRRPPSITLR